MPRYRLPEPRFVPDGSVKTNDGPVLNVIVLVVESEM